MSGLTNSECFLNPLSGIHPRFNVIWMDDTSKTAQFSVFMNKIKVAQIWKWIKQAFAIISNNFHMQVVNKMEDQLNVSKVNLKSERVLSSYKPVGRVELVLITVLCSLDSTCRAEILFRSWIVFCVLVSHACARFFMRSLWDQIYTIYVQSMSTKQFVLHSNRNLTHQKCYNNRIINY